MFLRKAIKIKVFTIFCAWLVIFTHSVIPHHHIQEPSGICHDLVHDFSSEKNLEDCSINGKPLGHEKVCHFAGNLFKLVNLDNFFYYYNNKILVTPVRIYCLLYNPDQDRYCLKPETGTISLRAPPLS